MKNIFNNSKFLWKNQLFFLTRNTFARKVKSTTSAFGESNTTESDQFDNLFSFNQGENFSKPPKFVLDDDSSNFQENKKPKRNNSEIENLLNEVENEVYSSKGNRRRDNDFNGERRDFRSRDGNREPRRDNDRFDRGNRKFDRDNREDRGFSFEKRERKDFGDRRERSDFGDRRERRDFGDRRERRDFGDRRERSDFGDRRERRDFGDRRERRDFGDRRERRDFGDRRNDYEERVIDRKNNEETLLETSFSEELKIETNNFSELLNENNETNKVEGISKVDDLDEFTNMRTPSRRITLSELKKSDESNQLFENKEYRVQNNDENELNPYKYDYLYGAHVVEAALQYDLRENLDLFIQMNYRDNPSDQVQRIIELAEQKQIKVKYLTRV